MTELGNQLQIRSEFHRTISRYGNKFQLVEATASPVEMLHMLGSSIRFYVELRTTNTKPFRGNIRKGIGSSSKVDVNGAALTKRNGENQI